MSAAVSVLDIKQYNTSVKPLTILELAFVSAYIANGGNGTQAAREAGYKCKSDNALARQASDLLRKPNVNGEISYRLNMQEEAKIAKPNEILSFYTSVMRGEVLDQFGIEASLDTRIKAANELAKHKIEIPLKLQQKEMSNNLGSITLNFLPRTELSNDLSEEN